MALLLITYLITFTLQNITKVLRTAQEIRTLIIIKYLLLMTNATVHQRCDSMTNMIVGMRANFSLIMF